MEHFSKADFLHELKSLDLDALRKDSGITEVYSCGKISVGISFETLDEPDLDEGYIFNLFLDGEYINVSGTFIRCEDIFIQADTEERIEDVLAERIKELKEEHLYEKW